MANFSHRQFVGRQRAEFERAARLQKRALQLQVGISVFGALSVILTAPLASYLLAVASFVLALIWAYATWACKKTRGQAERARRATLLIEGLGSKISQSEMLHLWTGFSSTEAEGANLEDDGYYDAREAPGIPRVMEMLEETSFWSCHLMQASARSMWELFGASAIFSLIVALVAVQIVDSGTAQSIARLVCLLLTLGVSAEILGSALAYQASTSELGKFGSRIAAVRATGFDLADVLMLLFDYNAAVEGAPMFVPGAYDREKDKLNGLWTARRS